MTEQVVAHVTRVADQEHALEDRLGERLQQIDQVATFPRFGCPQVPGPEHPSGQADQGDHPQRRCRLVLLASPSSVPTPRCADIPFASRQLAHLSRRLLGPASQQADPDHARQREPADAGVDVPDRADAGRIKATPILVNGVIYVTDARQHLGDRCAHPAVRSGATPIRRTPGSTSAIAAPRCTRTRCFCTTPDAHLVALDAKDGKVKWDVVIADAKKGYWSTNAPLARPQSPVRRRVGRLRQPARHAEVGRSGDRQDAVDRSTARRRLARPTRSAAARPADRCG